MEGDDTVGIVDSKWDDTLTVTPTRMTLQGALWNSTAFSLTAEDFPEAHAYAREGGGRHGHHHGNFGGRDAEDVSEHR